MTTDTLIQRVHKLGLDCVELPTDRLTSAAAALACFPMYMVANVHAWTPGTQFQIPLIDFPGFEAIREAFAIGRQERKLQLDPDHGRVLKTLLTGARPSDLVMYEYALDTLADFLDEAETPVAEETRTAVARMIVAVAQSSGSGIFGGGKPVSRHEEACIGKITERLQLRDSEEAAQILDTLV